MVQENDIRPVQFNQMQDEAIIADVKFLIDRKNDFVSVDCPTCGSKNQEIEMRKNGFEYLECSNCTMLYQSPRPTESILAEFYPQSKLYEVFDKYIFPHSAKTRRERIFRPRMERIVELCKRNSVPTNSILEIGSGYGFLLDELSDSKAFKRVVGTEASDSLFESAKDKDYEVLNGLLEHIDIDEKFDFVASFEVIEHVYNPKAFLEKANTLLNDNGIIMLSFPNYDGFDIGMLREHACAVDHEHLNYFNEKSISMLLEETGYKVIEVVTPGLLDADIVKTSLEKGLIKNSFLRRLLCSEETELLNKFQTFLSENKLSSHMIISAQKA